MDITMSSLEPRSLILWRCGFDKDVSVICIHVCVGDGGLDKKEIAYMKGMIFRKFIILLVFFRLFRVS